MTLAALREDALSSRPDGFALRLSLPWIRSLPIASLLDPVVEIDGRPSGPLSVMIGERTVPADALVHERGWWFIQDRMLLLGRTPVGPGAHEVSVSFRLSIPYLQAGPDGPLDLPFVASRVLVANSRPTAANVSRDVAPLPSPPSSRQDTPIPGRGNGVSWRLGREGGAGSAGSTGATMTTPLPAGWVLSASAFNLTPAVIEAERPAPEIAASLVAEGLATDIEIELGQLWRSFPQPAATEAHAFRDELATLGGRVSIVGGSIDDWASPSRRRTDDERYEFLVPQLQTAAALGATGLRLPLGQAGPALLERLVPVLTELDVVLFEEAQGSGSPSNPASAPAYETLDRIDDPHVRLLLDISMLMPALPVTYLEILDASELPRDLVRRLRDEWADPATTAAVVAALRGGEVPPGIHTLFMNLLVRFGRSRVEELEPVLHLLSAAHLKFWDLDDADGRVTEPIRDLAAAARRTGFTGTLCSEWGGQEWLDDDPLETTRAHLVLARDALAGGFRSAAA